MAVAIGRCRLDDSSPQRSSAQCRQGWNSAQVCSLCIPRAQYTSTPPDSSRRPQAHIGRRAARQLLTPFVLRAEGARFVATSLTGHAATSWPRCDRFSRGMQPCDPHCRHQAARAGGCRGVSRVVARGRRSRFRCFRSPARCESLARCTEHIGKCSGVAIQSVPNHFSSRSPTFRRPLRHSTSRSFRRPAREQRVWTATRRICDISRRPECCCSTELALAFGYHTMSRRGNDGLRFVACAGLR